MGRKKRSECGKYYTDDDIRYIAKVTTEGKGDASLCYSSMYWRSPVAGSI